jgi:GNAT superfamily N-acetyltransferase
MVSLEQGQVICRPFDPEDQAAVIAVLGASYEGWHGSRNEAVWEWKFTNNPYGPARIWVAADAGRIAGCYVLLPVALRVGARTIAAAQAVDAAVSPDYRGRGVFTDLARAALRDGAEAGVGLIFAFPSEGALGGQVRVGFKPQLAIPKTYRPLIWSPARRRFAELTLGEVNAFDPRFDVFCERRVDDEITLRRDAAYLQWRYLEHPTQAYEAIICERDGELRGYCVLKTRATRRLTIGYIVDLQVLAGSGSAARFLVYHALLRLRSRGARAAVSWERPGGEAQEALASFGFSPRYASIGRALRPAAYVDQLIALDDAADMFAEPGPGERLADSPRWSLVPGDADYV